MKVALNWLTSLTFGNILIWSPVLARKFFSAVHCAVLVEVFLAAINRCTQNCYCF